MALFRVSLTMDIQADTESEAIMKFEELAPDGRFGEIGVRNVEECFEDNRITEPYLFPFPCPMTREV
jgi:hypothetical protein